MQRSDVLSFVLVASGLNHAYSTRLAGPGFPILAYHEVSGKVLESHLKALAPFFRFMSLEDALDYRVPEQSRPPLVLTFDDGYRSWLTEVLPVLRRRRVPALFCPTVAYVDHTLLPWYEVLDRLVRRRRVREIAVAGETYTTRSLARNPRLMRSLHRRLKALPAEDFTESIGSLSRHLEDDDRRIIANRYLTWQELRELTGFGIEIGCHSATHPILSRLAPSARGPEIGGARVRLESELQRPVRYFAYPNGLSGDFDPQVIDEVRRSGFVAALTALPGRNTRDQDPYQLRRAVVDPAGSIFRLRATASGVLGHLETLIRSSFADGPIGAGHGRR